MGRKNSRFLLTFLIHIHVFMLCTDSSQNWIFKVPQESDQRPCTIVQGLIVQGLSQISSKIAR